MAEITNQDQPGEVIPDQDLPELDRLHITTHLFTSLPLLRDLLITETSQVQDHTVEDCLPLLSGENDQAKFSFNQHGIPWLNRDGHISFSHKCLRNLPSGYVAADASRPWMLYWALTGLYILGEDVSQYRDRVVNTLAPMQNPGGGFGGGHGHMSHAASSYAAVLSLILVGGENALNLIDRKKLWHWLGELKQPNGGFQVCIGGEEDVRGAYCSMVMISLLNLPLELPPTSKARTSKDDTFLTGLPEYLSRCQTFEGGLSESPGTEAHGAYAFCVLACLCVIGKPHEILKEYLDLPLLISWLSARQYAPEGGFSGRTNKLVDGCYSHWVGGCWPLIEAALNGPQPTDGPFNLKIPSLFSREGLIRYIMCCCQNEEGGGLRDKPSKYPDSYHSCYVLAGLSGAQHFHYFTEDGFKDFDGPLSFAFGWESVSASKGFPHPNENPVYDEDDTVNVVHPIFVIPAGLAEKTHRWFEERASF
ncbi:MAG: CAAX farnesyltransferase (FTase) subunit beta [Cirrosporium novae-zelandiae]|nr:MAG: CAAX farnesyltransferase (FTase) subunit beta [Cirrosporium novae-zelandiae]